MPPIVYYVHGAGATRLSFRWLIDRLPVHTVQYFDYHTDEGLSPCIDRLGKTVAVGPPCVVVGHSLGGVIAAAMAPLPPVQGVVSICAPFAGLPSATLLAMLRPNQLFRDVSSLNPALRRIREGVVEHKKPHLAIVGDYGLPLCGSDNDGVVPVESQMAIPGLPYSMFNLNHFEVLLSSDVSIVIDTFLQNIWTQ